MGDISPMFYLNVGGGKYVKGFQLRYIYFLDKKSRAKLTVPELPYSEIDRLGAGMYKGKNVTRQERHEIKCDEQIEREQQKRG